MGKKNDNWTFSLKEETQEIVAKSLAPKENTDRKEGSEHMTLDSIAIDKLRSRRKMIDDGYKLEFADRLEGNLLRRACAFAVDMGIIAAITVVSLLFFDVIKIEYIKLLGLLQMDQTLDPESLKRLLLGIIIALSYVLFDICFSIRFGRTIGKVMFGLDFSNNRMKPVRISSVTLFFREAIVKPIAILSLIGFIIPFTNSEGRSLHDIVCKTWVHT